MAPFPSAQGFDGSESLARSIGTPTTVDTPTLVQRQATTVTLVQDSGSGHCDCLSGGAIAGIVIGCIVGTLLLLWIIRSCFNLGAPPQEREKWYRDTPPRREHRRHHSRGSRHSSVSVPPPIIIRETSRSRQPSASYYDKPRGRSGSRYDQGYQQGY